MSEAGKAVFLSYASQDAEAARRIAEALRRGGVEVWFDQNELVGGDAWDAKIRRQIAECALFVPVISASTQARLEGYFRLEWKIAAQRTHTMADERVFLLPVVIDATRDVEARVPAEFKSVQWTRLPGGEASSVFLARVQALLLSGGASAPASARDPVEHAGAAAAPSRKGSRWAGLAWAAIGLAFAVIYAVRPAWPARNPPKDGMVSARPESASEAAKLVAKARAVLEGGDEMNRETYALAEDLLKRAEQIDVGEASAWALHAWLSADLYRYGLDRNEARFALVQAQASRAMALAPDTLDAQLANLRALAVARQSPPEIMRRQRELLAKFPDDPRCYRMFALFYTKGDESLFSTLNRGLERWPEDSRLQGDLINSLLLTGRYAEADEFADRATRGVAGTRVLAGQAFIRLWWQGDAAAAAAGIEKWPAWFLSEDRGAGLAAIVALRNRTPDVALEIIQKFPRDYLHDSFFTGPRGVLVAWAHEQAGRAAAAQAEWRQVLQVCDRELAAVPGDSAAMHWRAWALARLGDKAQADQILRVLIQRRVSIEALAQVAGGLAGLALAVDDKETALSELGRLATYDSTRTRPASRAVFDLNPLFDPLRSDPRFQRILEAAPAPAKTAALAAPAGTADKSVAVLAFDNRSDDKDAEYFSDGISEELINSLGRVPGLLVKGRTSAFFFKGRNATAQEIGEKLGVAYLVRGSVRKAGGRVRITAQLSRAATDEVVWSSATLERDLKDVFAVQDEIVALIAKNLSVQMGVTPRTAHQVNPEALTALLQGRQYWVLRTTEGFTRARESFNRAVGLDPDWAPAHAALANLEAIEASFLMGGGTPIGERFALAAREARRALALDPTLGEPHAALGKIAMENRRFAEAGEEFRRALSLEPGNALVHDWYGDLLVAQGRLDAAIDEYHRASELEPLSPYILWDLAWELMNVRRYGEALPLVEQAAALTPTGASRLSLRRARLLVELGRKPEAAAALRAYLEGPMNSSDPQFAHEAVWCLAALDSPADREHWADSLLRQFPDSYASGVIHLLRGQPDQAYPLLEKAPIIFWQQLYWEPAFDAVRDTPRFQQLLDRVGCAAEYKVARATLTRLLQEGGAKK